MRGIVHREPARQVELWVTPTEAGEIARALDEGNEDGHLSVRKLTRLMEDIRDQMKTSTATTTDGLNLLRMDDRMGSDAP